MPHPNDVSSCPYIFLHFLLSSPSSSFSFVVSSCFFGQGERRSFNKKHKLKVLKQLYITRAFLFCFLFSFYIYFCFQFFFSPPHRPLVQSVWERRRGKGKVLTQVGQSLTKLNTCLFYRPINCSFTQQKQLSSPAKYENKAFAPIRRIINHCL